MRNPTKLIIAILIFLYISSCFGQISNYFYGSNHWMPLKYLNFPSQPNGKIELDTIQKMMKTAGSMVYRIGGNGYDKYGNAIGPNDTTNDYIRAIDIIKARNPNAKFMIQVPFKSGITPAQAGQLVANILTKFGTADTFFYAIGNEWDAYVDTNGAKLYSVNDIKNFIINYAKEMKVQDPKIKIVAAGVTSYSATDKFGQHIMRRLFSPSSADNILGTITGTGTAADGKFFADVADFHSYGGSNGNLDSLSSSDFPIKRNGLLNHPTNSLRNNLLDLRTRLDSANASRPASEQLTFAVTEFNVCFKNPIAPIVPGVDTTNCPEGIASRSHFAGQYWADAFSEILDVGTDTGKTKVAWVLPWSVHESGGDGDTSDLGMTKGPVTSNSTPPVPLPTYHHYQLMTKYFGKGVYIPGASTISPSVKTFASAIIDSFAYVMILNRDNATYPFSIGFHNAYATGSEPLKMKFFMNNIPLGLPFDSANVYLDTIEANTTMVLQFNCRGTKLLKILYSLQDAQTDSTPHLKEIGNTDVDPQQFSCSQSGIGGVINTNTTYSNTTINITSDILLAGNTNLTFDHCIVVVAPNVEIKATPMASIDIINNTVMLGCDGKKWKGIYMIGNYNNGERLKVENSFIFNALRPIRTEKIPDLTIKGNIIANGETAIELNKSEKFNVTDNIIGGFKTGIKTFNTKPNYLSKITENNFLEIESGLQFNGDNHNLLDITCNRFRFSDKGIRSINTVLKDQGDITVSAGNIFERVNGGQQFDYIDHTGSPATYYFGPAEANKFNLPNIMNIPKIQAVSDKYCKVAVGPCTPTVGIKDEEKNIWAINVFPNPNGGSFIIDYAALEEGDWNLSIYDGLGKLVNRQNINTKSGKMLLQLNSPGIYFISLQMDAQRITRKVIVQ